MSARRMPMGEGEELARFIATMLESPDDEDGMEARELACTVHGFPATRRVRRVVDAQAGENPPKTTPEKEK